MHHKNLLQFKLVIIAIAALVIFPMSSVFGHGLGMDTISSIEIQDKEISITIEIPNYFAESQEKQITITAIDKETKDPPQNTTFRLGLFEDGKLIFRDNFFAPEGYFFINVTSTNGEIQIIGQRNESLDAWHATGSQPVEISGPLFESGGLYHFEVEITTIEDPTNVIDSDTFYADVSLVETTSYTEQDLEGNDVSFRVKSYFDNVSQLNYNPKEKIVTFEMPFDWSERQMSHIPVVHEEIHFPKEFQEFLYPSYVGSVNGVELFKSSVTVDDYTEDHERIVHFVLLQDHIRYLKNQQQKVSDELPETMTFTLTASENFQFPMIAYTKDEQFQIDLSWDPLDIEPGKNTKFIFTIRDGATREPLRHSSYDFVIVQNGKIIHKVSDSVSVGGGFEDYMFAEEQTGPTIVRFENIRGTGADTEFGLVVIPEFGTIAIFVLVVSIISVIILSKKNFLLSSKYKI